MKILAGDLGGTKALLGIAEFDGDTPRFILTRRLASADFSGADALLRQFCTDAADELEGVTGACLAIAGPVSDDGRQARFTNLPWQADAALLEQQLGMPLTLANDFVAVAAGIATLSADQHLALQTGEPLADGVRLVIGAGTGLGMATLVPLDDPAGSFKILPGEGGHIGFAPADAMQARVWTELLAAHGRVTAEQVISGPGIAAIHHALTGATADPAEITDLALGGNVSARQTVEVFLAAYGAFAGDLALALLARGGVFLAGGIAAKIMPLLRNGTFLAAFNAKAGHADLARRMPVHVVTDPEIGLQGAAALARRLLGH
jgi:glucokinase